MKRIAVTSILVGIVLVTVAFAVSLAGGREHDPKDLSYWMRAGAARDWSAEAAQGAAQAQFHVGLGLVRPHLLTLIDRVPGWSAIPWVGKRFFETISYGIDSNMSQEQLAEAYGWIKKSADQGFAPAQAALTLFMGRMGVLNQGGTANGSLPIRSETNRPPQAAGSRR